MPKEITLKPTVAALDKATKALEIVRGKATGEDKKALDLKITSLKKIRKELVFVCKSYPLWVPKKPKAKARAKSLAS